MTRGTLYTVLLYRVQQKIVLKEQRSIKDIFIAGFFSVFVCNMLISFSKFIYGILQGNKHM